MSQPRHMISHDVPSGRFNLRAAAIVLRDGYVLVTRTTLDTVWYLPGGRVEWGESTREAVAREIVEELGVEAKVGELAIILENFFQHEGRGWHEMACYFPATVPDDFPFRRDGEVCYRSRDGEVDLEFRWIRTDAETLRVNRFMPPALHQELAALPTTVRHIVWSDEAEQGGTAIA